MGDEVIRVGESVMPLERVSRNSMFHALWNKEPGVVSNSDEQADGLVVVIWRTRTGGTFKGAESMHNLAVVGDALEDAWHGK